MMDMAMEDTIAMAMVDMIVGYGSYGSGGHSSYSPSYGYSSYGGGNGYGYNSYGKDNGYSSYGYNNGHGKRYKRGTEEYNTPVFHSSYGSSNPSYKPPAHVIPAVVHEALPLTVSHTSRIAPAHSVYNDPSPSLVYNTPAPSVYNTPAPSPVYNTPAPSPVYNTPAPSPVYITPASHVGGSGSSSVYPDSFYSLDNGNGAGSLYGGGKAVGSLYGAANAGGSLYGGYGAGDDGYGKVMSGGSLYGGYGVGKGGYGGINWNAPGSPQGGFLVSGHYPNFLYKNIGYGPTVGDGLIRKGY